MLLLEIIWTDSNFKFKKDKIDFITVAILILSFLTIFSTMKYKIKSEIGMKIENRSKKSKSLKLFVTNENDLFR